MASIRFFRPLSLFAVALILLPLLAGCVPVPAAPQAPAAPAQPAATMAAPATAATATAAPATAAPSAAQAELSEAAQPSATGLEGQWAGPLQIGGQTLDMVVRFSGSGAALKGALDVPAQGAKDIPLSKVSRDGDKVHWEAFSGARLATYDGVLGSDGSLSGDFLQAGYNGSLILQRVAAQPTAIVPYHQEEVSYQNGIVRLACTLTTPPAGAPFPAVILITGSGAQNRDEDLFGFQPFRLIADHLARAGIAALRCDDRGVGGSTGDTTQSTSEDFAGDILAGVGYLKTRSDVDSQRIGLWGHSEGGIVAPMVASRSVDVAFIILMSGPGVTGEQIVETQLVDIMTADGSSQAEIDTALAQQKAALAAAKTGEGLDALKVQWAQAARARAAALPADQLKAMGGEDQAVAGLVQAQVDSIMNPWFRFFVTYDPAPTLAKVHVPVLALFGGKDKQVATAPNQKAIAAALASGGNTALTVKVFPDANHLYQQAITGSPSEYATLEKEFVPGLLDYVTEWIKATIK